MKNKPLLLLCSFLVSSVIFHLPSLAQGTWTQKADFGGAGRAYAGGFVIGTKGYIGCGDDMAAFPNGLRKDFWEYDQVTNAWTQKADFSGSARRKVFAFAVNGKGYFGCGQDASNYKRDVYEYNPSTNTWIAKANFGGTGRAGAAAFVIGTNGYAGTGFDGAGYKDDFWEYNPTTDTWTQKKNVPGVAAPRGHAFGFASSTKGYIGTGDNGSTAKRDVYEYDPASDTWTQKANFFTSDRTEVCGFYLNGKGYAGTGNVASTVYQDWREYDPASNTWTAKTNLTGSKRRGAVGFAIGTKGYVGTGIDNVFTPLNDFWEFNPGASTVGEYENLVDVSLFPNPFCETATLRFTSSEFRMEKTVLKFFDISGSEIDPFVIRNSDSFVIHKGDLPSGIYFFSLLSEGKILARGKLMME